MYLCDLIKYKNMKAIIRSILDSDLYKFSMQHAVIKHFPRLKVRYKFTDRNNTVYPNGFDKLVMSEVKKMEALYLTVDEKKFLTEKNQPERMILMVQNEVAKRIVARDGRESILSISIKAYAEPKMVMKVPARYFSPAPKVDSAVISIKNI